MKKMVSSKLLTSGHTGKIRHHRHTSYGALSLILLLTVVPLFAASQSVAFASTEGGGGYQTYAVVPAPTPKVAPTITSLTSGQTFTSSEPVNIAGGCPAESLVKIFKNEVLAGAALCQSGRYKLSVGLFVGANSLVARAYNANDVASPDSLPVTARLIPPGTILNGSEELYTPGAPAGQFYVTSEVFHQGGAVGEKMSWPIILAGGQAPYAVSVSWGDGKTDVYSRSDASRFEISHVYTDAAGASGTDTVVIRATDGGGQNSYLQLAALVRDTSPVATVTNTISGGSAHSTVIRTAWQGLGVTAFIAFSFWLGERREAHLLHSLVSKPA